MTREEILSSLKEALVTVKPGLDTGKVTEESSLLGDLGMDSLGMLLVSLAIEKKFGISFTPAETPKTVKEVVDYIAGQTK